MKLIKGNYYDVVPIKMEPFGIVVEAEDESTHLIHISQISKDYVDDVVNFVSIGNHYNALAIDGVGKKSVQLSLLHLGLMSQRIPPKKQKENSHKRTSSHLNSKSYQDKLDSMIAKTEKDYRDKIKSYGSYYKVGGKRRHPK